MRTIAQSLSGEANRPLAEKLAEKIDGVVDLVRKAFADLGPVERRGCLALLIGEIAVLLWEEGVTK